MTAKKKTEAHQLLKAAWHQGKVRLTNVHGNLRSQQRLIGMTEIRDVILYGEREEEQDIDRGTHWTYAIRNRDVDGFDIRMIVDVETYPDVVIVTVMHVYPAKGQS